jgi:arylsulfatase A-like enzyme
MMVERRFFLRLIAGCTGMLAAGGASGKARLRPNVILILTDDQGYGDLGAHGNPVLKTPVMDRLHARSVRFTDFHVAPMCSPTRSQLMTGMDAMRNGATAVCQGRSMIRNDLRIMPQYFADAGYATGMFGKWHLGDSCPHRPQDRGFGEVLRHRAWGITSLADHWGNCYFDPVLERNGKDTPCKGYCTDIFFGEAMKWIETCRSRQQPFFLYLPTNTPHVPNVVAEKYAEPYRGKHKGKPIPANFYGMIANIDENLGRLEAFLEAKKLRDNTILVFMGDNGTQSGAARDIFNAGMRDRKCSTFEGGHRVHFFVRWPGGKLRHGRDVGELAQAQDLLPTLIDLCGLDRGKAELDGASLAGLLTGKQSKLADRMLVSQYGVGGEKWKPAAVMWKKWRLLEGARLYDLASDPQQERDVSKEHPDVVRKMSAHYDAWYARAKPLFDRPRTITLGAAAANPTTLYASDWTGAYCDNWGGLSGARGRGHWDVVVAGDGVYELELRRWPEESGLALCAPHREGPRGKRTARPIARARLCIAGHDLQVDTKPEDTAARFTVELKAGATRLAADLMDAAGKVLCGAMYVKVRKKQAP